MDRIVHVLDKYENVVGVLSNSAPLACPYFDDEHLENIQTGVHTYIFSVPASHPTASRIEPNGYVLIRDLDNKMQMFKVMEITETGDDSGYVSEVYCEHIAVPELNGAVVRPVTLNSYTAEAALRRFLAGTGWVLGEYEYTESQDIKIDDYMTALEAILKVTELFSLELEYEVYFRNGEIYKRVVNVTEKRGAVSGKKFVYGKDLKGVKRKESSENVVTALVGIGKGDTDGARLTLRNYTHPSYPSYIIKYPEEDWVGDVEALQRYGKGERHIFGIFVDENATTQEQLYENTLKELKQRTIPVLSYDMDVALLERISGYSVDKVRIGDTIIVDDTSFNPRLLVEARVLELRRSYTNPENDGVVLGDYRTLKPSTTKRISDMMKKISVNEDKWSTLPITVRITSNNGLTFKKGKLSTTLEARVFKGTKDITETVPATNFIWSRKSKDASADDVWNNNHTTGTKTLTLSASDMADSATFLCSVTVD